MKHTPGPLPSSCLTCRQRRKKCDKTRPACERCVVGGFRCLGYDHIPASTGPKQPKASTSKQAAASSLRAPSTRDPKNRLGSPAYNNYRNISDATTDSGASEGDLSPKQPSRSSMQTTPAMSYRSIASVPSPVSSQSSRAVSQPDYLSSPSIPSEPRSSLVVAPRTVFGPPRPPVEESSPSELQQLANETWAQPLFSLVNTSGGSYNPSFVFNLPPTISDNPLLSGQITEFILSQYEPLLEMVFFRPTREILDFARGKLIVRLQESNLTHWSMYIGARIFQALMKDGKRADLRFLMSCVRRMDEHVCLESARDGSLTGALHALSSGLELVFVDFLTSNTRAGYQLFKRLTPTFIRASQSLPSFSLSQKVSLAEAFTAPHFELGRFVFMDAVSSLVFGVPPLIDYDTTTPFLRPELDCNGYPGCVHPIEWVHGSPLELTSLIVKVSLWRAKNQGTQAAPEETWKPLEAEAWAWAPRVSSPVSVNEPSQMVVRMAVQEGWRHAGLIYLYMGMCGCQSDDPRVQTSVRQILQLLQILQPDLTTRSHYFIPCLVASICTPSEKHRAELRNAFVKVEKCLPWLFRALDYKAIVDHLWHGAAAGGKPVKWDDYVESRERTDPRSLFPRIHFVPMPIINKSTPGPRGESCLTCRQRRKKCDKGRPYCERCLSSKGKFKCQGYDDEPVIEAVRPPKVQAQANSKTYPAKILPLRGMDLGVEFEAEVPGTNTRSAYFGFPASASQMNDYLSPSMDSLMVPGPPASSLLTAAPLAEQQGAGWQQITSSYKPRNVIALPLPVSIPRGVNANAQMRESYLVFVLNEYEAHRMNKFFRTPTISMRGFLGSKMKRSHRILGFMYLGAKIFETLDRQPEETAINLCSGWVTRYSNHVSKPDDAPNPYPTAQEVEDKLNGLLELVFLKFIVLGTSAGYASLRLALPNFLRLVSDEPSLWAEQGRSGLLGVSLPAAMSTNRIEIRRFVFYDIMCSLVLGLPTLGEYNSTGFPVVPRTDLPVEWVHGVPIELIVNITEVHNWRAQARDVDWGILEMRTLAWRWSYSDVQSEESAEMVHRIAIQESWRHATLIYIYMASSFRLMVYSAPIIVFQGICGATSHDPRVQASVHQIFKLMGVVGDAHLDVHFSIPSVIAGLAARYEPQRALIYRKLKTFNGMRLWTLRGQEFARVLRYLWRGPAVNGAAVGWDDYIQARSQVIPIP